MARIKEIVFLLFRVVPPSPKVILVTFFKNKFTNYFNFLNAKRSLFGWYTQNIRQILVCCFLVTCVCFFFDCVPQNVCACMKERRRMNPPVSSSIINANLFRGHHWLNTDSDWRKGPLRLGCVMCSSLNGSRPLVPLLHQKKNVILFIHSLRRMAAVAAVPIILSCEWMEERLRKCKQQWFINLLEWAKVKKLFFSFARAAYSFHHIWRSTSKLEKNRKKKTKKKDDSMTYCVCGTSK